MNLTEQKIEIPAEYILSVFGKFDSYIKKIERTLHVTVIDRGEGIKLIGTAASVDKAARVIGELVESAKKGNTITEQDVNYALSMVFEDKEQVINEINNDVIAVTTSGKQIKPKTLGQTDYVDQIKMFLTRIGFGSKAVITGDITQKDLPPGQKSGLNEALKIIKGIDEIGITYLSNKDVVRHPLVQKIVEAYDKYESKEEQLSIQGNSRSRVRKQFDKM